MECEFEQDYQIQHEILDFFSPNDWDKIPHV